LFEDSIPVNFSDMLDDIRLPRMFRVHQSFPKDSVMDIDAEVAAQMKRILADGRAAGKRIAVTAGSRGIRHGVRILRNVVNMLRTHGADPFLIPAMGSHGGGTPQGQLSMLRHLGITEESVGAPIVATMDTAQIGELDNGTPVYCSADALAADGIFVLNKIKPHADFKGEFESGLIKMLAIGLGKHKGCSTLHRLGFASFPQMLPAAAKVVLREANILGGLAILENAYDEIMRIEAVFADEILNREAELLNIAKRNIARILIPEIDVLIVGEIGKHISGEGMDPNVTGRPGSYLTAGFEHTRTNQIVVLDIAEQSAGNGAGIGMADISTLRCVHKLDLGMMYTNSITAGILGPSRLPVVLNNDREAIRTAIKIGAAQRVDAPRMVLIRNTLLLEDILVSQPLLDEVEGHPHMRVLEEVAWRIGGDGYLIDLPFETTDG